MCAGHPRVGVLQGMRPGERRVRGPPEDSFREPCLLANFTYNTYSPWPTSDPSGLVTSFRARCERAEASREPGDLRLLESWPPSGFEKLRGHTQPHANPALWGPVALANTLAYRVARTKAEPVPLSASGSSRVTGRFPCGSRRHTGRRIRRVRSGPGLMESKTIPVA